MGWEKASSFMRGAPVYVDVESLTQQCLFVGRWFPTSIGGNSVMTAINQGSQIQATVVGTTSVTANFYLDPNSAYVYYIAYSIDGAAYTRAAIAAATGSGKVSVSLATGLTTASHTVKIVAAGLYEHDAIWDSGVGLHFMGLSLDAGARSMPWSTGKKRILFLGDSITAGINLLGTGATPDINAGEQNYAHLCAANLGVDPWQVGFGASGVTTGGSGGVPPAGSNFPYFMYNRPLSESTPDVIVVNHGTNDSAATTSTFQTDYQNYITGIQSTYPNVPICCMRPFDGNFATQIQAVVTATSGTHYVDTSTWNITTTDGTHPNQAGSQTAGTNLANALTTIFGSSFFA